MPRKPAAELSVVPLIPGEGRPPPPEDLTRREAEIWRSIVDPMPSRWFGRETWPLLRALCLHTVMLEQLRERWKLNGYNSELAKDIDRETGAIARLSRALRIAKLQRQGKTNAQRVDETAIRNAPRKRLWEE